MLKNQRQRVAFVIVVLEAVVSEVVLVVVFPSVFVVGVVLGHLVETEWGPFWRP